MRMKTMRGAFNHFIILIVAVITFAPIYLVIVNSVKSSAEASSMSAALPTTLQWSNYATVIERGRLVTAFGNSLLYSSVSTLLGVSIAAMAAYVLSRNRTRFNRAVYYFIIMGIAMPTNFVTLTRVMQVTHLINTQIGMILLYASSLIPFTTFLVYAFVETLPRELDEAAIIDGCSPFRLFVSIIYPLLIPVLITAGVLNFLGIWNDFINPLYYLNNSDYWPMTLAVYNFFGQFSADWNLVSADVVLTIIPVIIVYLLAQRWILSGMVAGAVKS